MVRTIEFATTASWERKPSSYHEQRGHTMVCELCLLVSMEPPRTLSAPHAPVHHIAQPAQARNQATSTTKGSTGFFIHLHDRKAAGQAVSEANHGRML
jgi:hypothetical protein